MSIHVPLDLRASVLAGRAADALRHQSRLHPSAMVAVTVGGIDAEIPAAAIEVLIDTLDALSIGQDVVAAPGDLEIGTTEAARLLGVSRTWVANLVDKGQIEGRRNGTKRRITLRSALDAVRRDRDAAGAALDEPDRGDQTGGSPAPMNARPVV